MSTLNDFVGFNAKSKSTKWLNEFFHGNGSKGKAIFYGQSGNGKTLLVRLLSKSYDTELLCICPFDIKGEDNLNNFIKSVNSKSLFSKGKMVLIDDIDEFQSGYRKKLLKITSIYPIIYTTKSLGKDIIPEEVKRESQIVFIKKPLTSEIIEHLKSRCSLPMDKIEEIAKNSKSVRSAELSIYNECINEMINPMETYNQLIYDLKQRCLTQTVNRDNIHTIFRSIKGYDKDSLSVMEKIAEMDFRIKYQYENIDPWFINHMIEPIDKVIDYQEYKSKNNNKKKPKKEVKEKVEKTPEKKKKLSIDDFLK